MSINQLFLSDFFLLPPIITESNISVPDEITDPASTKKKERNEIPTITTVFLIMLRLKNEDLGLGPREVIQQVSFIVEPLLTLEILTSKSFVLLNSISKDIYKVALLLLFFAFWKRKIQARKHHFNYSWCIWGEILNGCLHTTFKGTTRGEKRQ